MFVLDVDDLLEHSRFSAALGPKLWEFKRGSILAGAPAPTDGRAIKNLVKKGLEVKTQTEWTRVAIADAAAASRVLHFACLRIGA